METAAPEIQQGGGCFFLPPLMVVLASVLFGYFMWDKTPQADSPPATANISPIFQVEIQYWSGSISRWADATGLDPNLVATVMQIESCGDPRAKSSAGAMGLFQVMPYHFSAGDDPYAPDINAARGLAYLAKSLQTAQGDSRLALAGYNGGIGVIPRAEWTWSAQTQRYVQYGAPIYEDARGGLSSSDAMNEWYENYGASLCKQAHQRLGLP
ncbi:MAG: transglycosylase SLT domain-containing protein [Anaerolineales bacterium]|nr:transglycosylase SLT domain-containing protein [Anaerolineales bacterium]